MTNKKYAIIERPDERSKEYARLCRERLSKEGFVYDEEEPDLVLVIGGDGTFIYAVHKYIEKLDHVVFYGMHTGTLGFMTDYLGEQIDAFLQGLLSGEGQIESFPLLEAKTDKEHILYALNEVRLENAARTQTMNVYINGQLFEEFRGTGLCLCTQLGSTAYNRSLGGAILQEGLPLLEMTEISGIHHSKYRSLGTPLILSDSCVVTWEAEDFGGALLGTDNIVLSSDEMKRITVQRSNKVVRLLRTRRICYFERLKSLF